jgi:hypothetical protein
VLALTSFLPLMRDGCNEAYNWRAGREDSLYKVRDNGYGSANGHRQAVHGQPIGDRGTEELYY